MPFQKMIQIEAGFGKYSICRSGPSRGGLEKTKFIGIDLPGVQFVGDVQDCKTPLFSAAREHA